jgi:hypothetical protein
MTADTSGDAGSAQERSKRRNRWFLVFASLLVLALLILALPAFQQVRNGEGWSYSANCVKQTTIGLLAYHDANGHFPPAVIRGKDGTPLYS